MDIIGRLRGDYPSNDYPAQLEKSTLGASIRPQTVTEYLDAQIKYHENKIADLKAAKEAVSPEVERALNALAKL